MSQTPNFLESEPQAEPSERPDIWAPRVPADRGFGAMSWHQLFRETPSWLTSCVVHLAFFLAIMSVASPMHSQKGAGAIQLTMAFTDDNARSTTSMLEVQVPQSTPDSESESDRDQEDSVQSQLKTAVEPQPMSAPPASSQFSAIDIHEFVGATTKTAKYAALTMGRPQRLKPITSHLEIAANPQQQRQFDQVVDRFISFDIGRLRGEAGRRANRKFRELGPEAFPALIRGLNKSAYIHATCPVGVIASKIMSTLQKTQDPSLAQFALEHIGEGVRSDAPHHNRLVSLRDRWIRPMQGVEGKLTELMAARGLDGDGEMFELALSLADSPSENLIVALDSDDHDLFVPAMVALLQRNERLTPQQQVRAQRALAKKSADDLPEEHRPLFQESMGVLKRNRQKHEFGNANANAPLTTNARPALPAPFHPGRAVPPSNLPVSPANLGNSQPQVNRSGTQPSGWKPNEVWLPPVGNMNAR